jgi:glycosyltransferase involved in cell wall biosynthesis
VILNGIDLKQHQPMSCATKRSGNEVVVVGFLGALVDRKGVQTLIKAFSKMNCNAKLLIVGDGPQRQMLEDMAKATGRDIEFSGHSNNVLAQLAKMDVLVVPSETFESFGLVVLEGMAAKLPLVVSDCGGMKEIVIDQVTGLIFPTGDVDSLTNALERLVHNPEKRELYGNNGYRILTKDFLISRVNSNYMEIVRQVMESKT